MQDDAVPPGLIADLNYFFIEGQISHAPAGFLQLANLHLQKVDERQTSKSLSSVRMPLIKLFGFYVIDQGARDLNLPIWEF
jgi:hypothetical protein